MFKKNYVWFGIVAVVALIVAVLVWVVPFGDTPVVDEPVAPIGEDEPDIEPVSDTVTVKGMEWSTSFVEVTWGTSIEVALSFEGINPEDISFNYGETIDWENDPAIVKFSQTENTIVVSVYGHKVGDMNLVAECGELSASLPIRVLNYDGSFPVDGVDGAITDGGEFDGYVPSDGGYSGFEGGVMLEGGGCLGVSTSYIGVPSASAVM